MAKTYKFGSAPGHLIRRAHQFAVSIFMEETAAFGVTPVQFAILTALIEKPGEDQITLAGRVAFDAATSGSVIGRLEAKGWIRRQADPKDRRRKLLWVTAEGLSVVANMRPAVSLAQQRILSPLTEAEGEQLAYLLDRLVAGHEGLVPQPPRVAQINRVASAKGGGQATQASPK